MKFTELTKLADFIDSRDVEKQIVHSIRDKHVVARLNHRTGTLHFGTTDLEVCTAMRTSTSTPTHTHTAANARTGNARVADEERPRPCAFQTVGLLRPFVRSFVS